MKIGRYLFGGGNSIKTRSEHTDLETTLFFIPWPHNIDETLQTRNLSHLHSFKIVQTPRFLTSQTKNAASCVVCSSLYIGGKLLTPKTYEKARNKYDSENNCTSDHFAVLAY